MSDEQLEKYIHRYGDRLALRFFLSSNDGGASSTSSEITPKRKFTVLDRLRKKLRLQSHGGAEPESSEEEFQFCSLPGTKANVPKSVSLGELTRATRKMSSNALKSNRLIELCWQHLEKAVKFKRHVKLSDGGGIRQVRVSKQSTVQEILVMATDLFFPNGISKFGLLTLFKCTLCDFKGMELDANTTVGHLYEASKLHVLRFYLQTRNILEESDDESLEEYEGIFMASSSTGSCSESQVGWHHTVIRS